MACIPHDDRPVGPAPIDILPDDVLVHLVDTYLDDRSLGACLLAWRRFHVLDRRALFRRKYRWATLRCLCLAGDHDGLDYALEHLAVYGKSDDLATTSCLVAMAGAGHVTMIERVVRMHDMEWPVNCKLWSSLVFALAKGGHGDALAWLCRAGNRPHAWDEDAIAKRCRNIVDHACGAEVIDRVLGAIEASGDSRAMVQRRIWRLVAAQQRQSSSLSSLPTTKQVAAAVHGVIEVCSQVQNFGSGGYDGICDMIRVGHMGLIRDLVGSDMLIASLRHIQRIRPTDPDDALWVYDNVDSCDRKCDGLFHLLHVASRTGRLDLLDRIEADLPLFSPRPGHTEREFARAYVHAAVSGHAAFVDRVLAHAVDMPKVNASFALYRHSPPVVDPPGRSPLLLHRGCRELVEVLLDRRPRDNVPQDDVDDRVDHMIALTVRDALRTGDLATVRWLWPLQSDVVEAMVALLRGQDMDCVSQRVRRVIDPFCQDAQTSHDKWLYGGFY
ncbi:hypothetical protein pclt_cds_940 [Pandoravirus celtis]|uniref:Ankyrin repeat domain containing protein n=1 Tax=Pandoravirus celtis TaxID=2568002 RepID=A0A4D6EI72_9VIRU|nr:hypothetical protein pclt_cds_940 [Pandoravirus celtis]